MPNTFTAISLRAGTDTPDSANFDISPGAPDAARVCGLFAEFLADRPPQFRDQLAFLKRGKFELDWSAAVGGVALATFYESGEPALMCVLLSGVNPDADSMMSGFFRQTILDMVAPGGATIPDNRPMLYSVNFSEDFENAPLLNLLSTALASVFFRCILELTSQAPE